jgi:NAD(P)-dependent dehydrogenase (short-subunit alcohol dehydrogenase family)
VCDVADDASVRGAVEQALASYGRIDCAFNAAGIDGEGGNMTADCTLDNWHRVMSVNLTGVWHCLRHQIPAMLQTGGGAIVNCASSAGVRGAAWCGAYSASKHGVVGLTKTAALEYASQGIRINAVCPGMIETPMTQKPGMGELIAQLVQASPLQRIGLPEEIGAAVLWLCGPDASFVHGQAIAVDGAITSR